MDRIDTILEAHGAPWDMHLHPRRKEGNKTSELAVVL